jgi:hypothetical protein
MPETAVGEDRRDSEMAEVDQCWSVVAGMGQWWSEVGAGVEQGDQCGLFGRISCTRGHKPPNAEFFLEVHKRTENCKKRAVLQVFF